MSGSVSSDMTDENKYKFVLLSIIYLRERKARPNHGKEVFLWYSIVLAEQ